LGTVPWFQGHGLLYAGRFAGRAMAKQGADRKGSAGTGAVQISKDAAVAKEWKRFMNECAGGLEANEVRMPGWPYGRDVYESGSKSAVWLAPALRLWERGSPRGAPSRSCGRPWPCPWNRLNLRFIWIGLFIAGCHEYLSTRPRPEFRSLFPPRPSQKSILRAPPPLC
jgi:hypothetical protein